MLLARPSSRRLTLSRSVCISLGCAVLLTGCASRGPTAPDDSLPPPTAAQLSGTWIAGELPGIDLAKAFEFSADRPALVIAPDGMLTGYTGVNRLTGKLDRAKLERGEFTAGPIASTRRAGPEAQMQTEAAFLRALADAKRVGVRDGALLLLDGQGKTLVTFIR